MAGVELEIVQHLKGKRIAARVVTDEDGLFASPRVFGSGMVLLVHATPWRALADPLERPSLGLLAVSQVEDADLEDVEFVVPWCGVLQLRVRTEAGEPASGAVVSVVRSGEAVPTPLPSGSHPVTVDAGGVVRLAALPCDRDLTLLAHADGWLPAKTERVRATAEGSDHVLVLERGAKVSAWVDLGDKPLPKEMSVHLMPQAEGCEAPSSSCDARGRALLEGVAAGSYVAVATAGSPLGRNRIVASSEPFRIAGTEVHVVLTPRRPLRIEGTVVQPNGTPFRTRRLGDQTVGPAMLVCRPVSLPARRATQLNQVHADARSDGSFSLSVPVPGVYELAVVGRPGVLALAGTRDVCVPHGALVPGLRVVVRDSGGDPVSGARVLMISAGAGETEAQTNAEGVAESFAMDAGEALVLASARPHGAAVARVRVNEDAHERQLLTLVLRKVQSVRGVLLDEQARPRSRERIHAVVPLAGRFIRLPSEGARTNAKGEFTAAVPLLEGVRFGVACGLGSGFVLPAERELGGRRILVLPRSVRTRSPLHQLPARELDDFLSGSR